MKRCTIVVSAYQVPRDWIDACLASIAGQEPRPGWSYELRLGVDGCDLVRAHLEERGVPFWWNDVNAGVYVMRNSLVGLRPAHAFAFFDADDVMFPHYLRRLLAHVEKGLVAGPGRTSDPRTLRGEKTKKWMAWGGGVCALPAGAWTSLGGFRPDRIASDSDLHIRARHLRIRVQKVGPALYYRRLHDRSLSMSQETGERSAVRRAVKRAHKKLRLRGEHFVHPVTVPLTEINL